MEYLDFIDNLDVSFKLKTFTKNKLTKIINNDIIRQIILFDLFRDLNSNVLEKGIKYLIFTPEFLIDDIFDDRKINTYNLIVYENKQHRHWAFKIDYTIDSNIEPEEKFGDKEAIKYIKKEYGKQEIFAFLYLGKSCIAHNFIYLNISDFLLAINKYKNIKIATNHLIQNI